MSRLCSRVLADVHRTLEEETAALARAGSDGARPPVLLDVGCWDGAQTLRYAAPLGARCLGIEIFPEPAAAAEARGLEVAHVDLECEPFPWPDASVDVVVCNQVLEHLKNIWLPLSEMFRVLRPGGHALLSVPNLGSLHNRVMLALGLQPTSIRTFGPHVRGYTLREFRGLVGFDDGFEVRSVRGVGFHPIPAPFSRPFAMLWPGGSHTIVVCARKRAMREAPWLRYLGEAQDEGMQTFYEG